MSKSVYPDEKWADAVKRAWDWDMQNPLPRNFLNLDKPLKARRKHEGFGGH